MSRSRRRDVRALDYGVITLAKPDGTIVVKGTPDDVEKALSR